MSIEPSEITFIILVSATSFLVVVSAKGLGSLEGCIEDFLDGEQFRLGVLGEVPATNLRLEGDADEGLMSTVRLLQARLFERFASAEVDDHGLLDDL
ncbi:MAG: hypothetical protein AB7O86_05950 [Porticoccaceae bacterium]